MGHPLLHPARTLALALALAGTACATIYVGRDFDLEAVRTRLVRGETTQEQVKTWIGAPVGSGVVVDTNGNRFEEWTYYHGYGRLQAASSARVKVLQIKFDERGRVQGYNWSAGD